MEIFDLYDRHGNKLNKYMERGGRNLQGEYHLVMHIWFRNNEGLYLIQQRNKEEDEVPYQWAATGGAALKGEDSLNAALREIREELGIDLEAEELKLVKRYVVEDSHANFINDLYLVTKDIPLEAMTLDPVEVKAVAYSTMADIQAMIAKGNFWDYARRLDRSDYFEILEKSE